ncbi:MAG: hypothetical protein HC805_05915, partial [Alkalinema sp. RL_2_19]|nr:hypothetical protein [Alkalinema sp. RL_2_19]
MPLPDVVLPTAADAVLTGLAASGGEAVGQAVVLQAHQVLLQPLSSRSILVTSHLTPEWLPLMRNVAGIITEAGGITSHAAIVARSLGIPAIVGVPQATQTIQSGHWLRLEAGKIHFISPAEALAATARPVTPQTHQLPHGITDLPPPATTKTQLLVTISHPTQITLLAPDHYAGIGLLRGEHLLAAHLAGVSPWQSLSAVHSQQLQQVLQTQMRQVLTDAIGHPIWYRLADWRSHEVRHHPLTPIEVNPALGLHGTLRYQQFPDWLDCELQAI